MSPIFSQQTWASSLALRLKKGVERRRCSLIRMLAGQHKDRLIGERSSNIIWIVGDGRSGSSWLQHLLMDSKDYLGLFEPFHYFNPALADFQLNVYQRPGSENRLLEKFANDVFNLNVLNNRVVEINDIRTYRGVVVKDVFASLMAKWVLDRVCSKIRPVILIRNPIDVALSKCKLDNWVWGPNPARYLDIMDLRADHLDRYIEEILSTAQKDDQFLNYILVWCILNRVLIDQFSDGSGQIVRYEDILSQPVQSVTDLMVSLDIEFDDTSERFQRAIEKVSHVSDTGGVRNSKLPMEERWMKRLSSSEIDEALRIVDAFDLVPWCAGY